MAYSTKIDVRNQISDEDLKQLTAETGPIDDTQVAEAVADADAEMDAYLGSVTTVPVTPTTSLLTKLSVDIAIYNLFSRRSIMVDIRRQRYEDAIALLRRIASGEATLGSQESPVHKPAIESSTRVFSREKQILW